MYNSGVPIGMSRALSHLGHDLELLALAVLGLGNGGFQTLEGLVVEFLILRKKNGWMLVSHNSTFLKGGCICISPADGKKGSPYLSRSNIQLNLPPMSTHQNLKLLTNPLQSAQPVVLGEGLKEVPQDLALLGSSAHGLLQFLDDVGLIGHAQGWGIEDDGELGVLLEDVGEGAEGLGGWFQAGGFGGGGVLWSQFFSDVSLYS